MTVSSVGASKSALERIVKIVGMVTETAAPTTAVNNGFIRVVDGSAYAAFYDDSTGVQQFLITDFMGEWTITEIDFFDNLLYEDGFYVQLEDGSRILMENTI